MVDPDKLRKDNISTVREMVASFPVRAIQLYAPREENIDEFEQFIDEVIAPVGITHVSILVYYKFEYKSHPEIVEKPFTSVAVAKRVAAVCKRNGITVVPEIDFPSHQSSIRRDGDPEGVGVLRAYPDMAEPYDPSTSTKSVCLRHPRLRPIIYDMIDDLMEAFDTKVIHTGFDEVQNISKCPRCKHVPPHILIAELTNDLNRYVRGKGGEMWVWGDRLLDGKLFPIKDIMYETSIHNTAGAINLVDKDIVICDWHYNYEQMGHLTPGYWEMKGFKHLSCSFNSIKGTEQLVHATNVLKESPRTLGTYLTTWADLDSFMRLTREKLDGYKRTGGIVQNAPETADIHNSHNFADQSSNIFLKMYVGVDGD